MTEWVLAPVRAWLAAPMDPDVSEAIERLRHAPGRAAEFAVIEGLPANSQKEGERGPGDSR